VLLTLAVPLICKYNGLTTLVLAGYIVTDLINALPGNSSVNKVQHATIDEAVFSTSSALSSGETTGLCNPLLGTEEVHTLPRRQLGSDVTQQ
jgi:hypothetical protein